MARKGDGSDVNDDDAKNGDDNRDGIDPVNNQKAKVTSIGHKISGRAAAGTTKRESLTRPAACRDVQESVKYRRFDSDDLITAGFILATKAHSDR